MSSVSARNFVAPLDLRERKLLSMRMRLLPLLIVISVVIIALIMLKRFAPDSLVGALIPQHLGLSLLCLIPVYVYAVVLRMNLIRDLARGVKIVREAVLENKKKIDSDDSTSFRIFLTVSGSSPPLTFQVPEEVHDSLVKGQAIRVSYAPRSMTVLELQSNGYHYLPVE